MKIKYNLLGLMISLISCQSIGQNRISINIPSAQSEAAYIWRTIQDIKFFEAQNYQVSLPKGDLIEVLKQKSKVGDLNEEDYGQLEVFVLDSVYSVGDYQKGYEKIEQELTLINQMINQLDKLNFKWDFKEFSVYPVNLTLYGPGGSFNPDEGSLLIYTTTKGQFKNYDNPANTIIHEIIHIGIEESIISKYTVPHALKERIVDTFVALNFGQYLPEYKIQDMSDKRADQYFKEIADLEDLDNIVQQILHKN